MIFVTDPEGKASYLSREWTDYTGQVLEDARDYGWAVVVHPDDVGTIRRTVAEAVRTRSEFSVRYRLRSTEGRFRWVTAGAVPSFGPPDRTFLGFFGSITPLDGVVAAGGRACGSLGRYVPPPGSHRPADTAAEAIADHLLIVHALAARIDNARLAALVSAALQAVGEELARGMEAERAAARIH